MRKEGGSEGVSAGGTRQRRDTHPKSRDECEVRREDVVRTSFPRTGACTAGADISLGVCGRLRVQEGQQGGRATIWPRPILRQHPLEFIELSGFICSLSKGPAPIIDQLPCCPRRPWTTIQQELHTASNLDSPAFPRRQKPPRTTSIHSTSVYLGRSSLVVSIVPSTGLPLFSSWFISNRRSPLSKHVGPSRQPIVLPTRPVSRSDG